MLLVRVCTCKCRQVHAKVQAALNKVVDPAVFDVPDGHVPTLTNFTFPHTHSLVTSTAHSTKGRDCGG